jgi:hypothetical protein
MLGICVASPAIVKPVPRGRSRNAARSSSSSLCAGVRVLIDVSKGPSGQSFMKSSREDSNLQSVIPWAPKFESAEKHGDFNDQKRGSRCQIA